MAFYFRPFPTTQYDIKKNGKTETLTNIMLRFKVQEYLQSQAAVYYNYSIQDSDRPDIIAFKYYEDATLDWIILLTNNIIDPHYGWPLNYNTLTKFIKKKYGSLESAQNNIHHYEQLVSDRQVLSDGTVVPEVKYIIDQDTYTALDPANRRAVSNFTFEFEENEKKREIKILDKRYITSIINNVPNVFK